MQSGFKSETLWNNKIQVSTIHWLCCIGWSWNDLETSQNPNKTLFQNKWQGNGGAHFSVVIAHDQGRGWLKRHKQEVGARTLKSDRQIALASWTKNIGDTEFSFSSVNVKFWCDASEVVREWGWGICFVSVRGHFSDRHDTRNTEKSYGCENSFYQENCFR